MKKLIIAILLLASFNCFSQGGFTKPNNSYGTVSNRASIDSILFFPTGCGTPTLRGYDLHKGAQYFDSCAHVFYVYDPALATWGTVGGGNYLDSFWRVSGIDSNYYRINGVTYSVKDSTGGGGTPSLTQYRLAVGDASNLLSSNAAITGGRALASDANGVPVASSTTATELGYVSGVTSSIQTQLNAKLSNITGLVTAGTNVTVTGSGTSGSPYVVSASGGGGSSNTVTEQKIYYRGEYVALKGINTTTGALSAGTNSITGYLHVFGSESVTISSTNNYSNITIYGWTYDTTLTAISEIRSNTLISTKLGTYTFTTPSNARFMVLYVKYDGFDFAKALQVKSTSTITYNTPITPEQFTGSKSVPIQKAIDFARFTSNGVVLNGYYTIDSTLLLSSGSTLILNNATLQLDAASHTNVIRNESVANPYQIFDRANRNIKILGYGKAVIQGSNSTWGGYPATGVGTQYWRAINTYLANVDGFEISGITFKNTNMWGFCAEQSRMGIINNVVFENDSSHSNQDGINIRRGSERISIENIRGTTWDDIVALTNLKIGGDSIQILGVSKIYQPYKTNADIQNILIKNIHRDSTGTFPIAPVPFYKGGILLLCEDSLRVHDVTIDGITGNQQIQIGFTTYQYWIARQATVDDMYNIGIYNTNSAKINFMRPIKSSTLFNIAPTDALGATNAVFPVGIQNVMRKYYNANIEYFDASGSSTSSNNWLVTGNTASATNFAGTVNNVSYRLRSNNVERAVFDSTGKIGFGTVAPSFGFEVSQPSAAGLLHTAFLTPNMTANQKSRIAIGRTWAGNQAYYWEFNYNSTDASRYLALQDAGYFPGANSFAMVPNGNIGIGTLTPASKLSVSGGNIAVTGGNISATNTTTTAATTLSLSNDLASQALLSTYGSAYTLTDLRNNFYTGATNTLYLGAESGTVGAGTTKSVIVRPGGYTSTGQMMKIKLTGVVISPGVDVDATSTFQVVGSFSGGYVAKTGTYTATISDYTIDCTANTFTVTLPTAVGITGRIYNVTNSGAGVITIATTSSQTFTNVTATPTTLTLSALGSYKVQSTGANWIVL